MGDCVMATPTLRALREHFPQSELIAVSKGVVKKLIDPLGWIDRWVTYRGNRELFHQAFTLRKDRLDVIVSLPSSLSTGLACGISGARKRIGYAREGRAIFFNDAPRYAITDENGVLINEIDRYLHLVGRMGCSTDNRRSELRVTPEDHLLCDQLWKSLGFAGRDKVVVLNSSAAVQPAKRLPDEHMIQVSQRLCEDPEVKVLLHCGPGEQRETEALTKKIDHPNVKSMAGFEPLPIGLSLAVMQRADLVISTDSGPRHMAVALDRKVISIFGPTDPLKTRSFNSGEVLVQNRLECRPCYKDTCRLNHHKCLADLQPAKIVQTARKLLAADADQSAA